MDSLQPARFLCLSQSPRNCLNACSLSWWYYLTISLSTVPSLFAFNLSQHQSLFQWLALWIRWSKYWNISISPSSEYSGLISFWINWFDLLAVQGTLKSILQHDNLKASILQHSDFFIVQLSHLYMTTGKTIPLTTWAFVGKVMPLPFNTEIWSMPSEIHNVGREEAKV